MTAIKVQSYYIRWIAPDQGDGVINKQDLQYLEAVLGITQKAIKENYYKWVSDGYGLDVIKKVL